MTLISRDELAQKAGFDPWKEQAQLAKGDPAQVEGLAAAFYKAGGDMTTSNSYQQKAQHYVGEGYQVNGASPVDFDAQAAGTKTSPEHLQQIGKTLDSVAGDLDGAISKATSEVNGLNGELASIEQQWASFMQQTGHHLPPEDREAARNDFINQAVAAVKAHGGTVRQVLTGYEETLFGAQRTMADLGYVPPSQLDDLGSDADAYVKNLQTLARKYADELKNNHSLDENWAKDAHKVAGEIAPYLDDPYFSSAFYGELGPQLTQILPNMLYASGSHTAGEDLKTFSHAFGAAVSNANDDPGMKAVADQFLVPPREAATSWSRAAMASNGHFPPDWLAQAARANALDEFAQHGADGFGGMGFRGGPAGSFPYDVGVPDDVVAAWTQDLGGNPVASREALATMGQPGADVHIHGDPTAAYQENIHKLVEYGKDDSTGSIAHGYGAAFEAAAGADNETDGSHSPEAVTFAKALFNDMAHDSKDVPPIAAQNFAKIGGSYVQEMAAGHNAEGDHVTDVGEHDRITGDNAAFDIPPEVAQSYMKTFAGNEEATKIFDSAAGQAAHHAMLAGAQSDVDLLKHGQSAYQFNHASEAYGSVAGAENSAAVAVVGKQVEDDEHAKEIMKGILSAGVDMIPAGKLAEAAGGAFLKVSDSVWDAMKHTTNMGLEHAYGAPSGSAEQLAQLKDQGHEVAMVSDYERTAVLHEAGYPGTDKIPPELTDGRGHMLNVAQVMSDDNLKKSYYDYMNGAAHRAEGTLGEGASVYDITRNAANSYIGGYQKADKPE
jgi:hypothetical protein